MPESPQTPTETPTEAEPTAEPARPLLRQALLRPGRSQFLMAIVCCLVAMAVVMQIRARATDDTYSTARRVDLVQLVGGLGQESRRLESQVSELEQTKRELTSGSDAQRVAREQARQRLDTLQVLAGTAAAQGPGVRITITDPNKKVSVGVLLDAIEEFRDAGGEAIEINDRIRVVGSSAISGVPGALQVDGQPVGSPIVLEVIGDSHALSEAARFRGGLASEITSAQIGGQIDIRSEPRVEIRSLHVAEQHQYARPAR